MRESGSVRQAKGAERSKVSYAAKDEITRWTNAELAADLDRWAVNRDRCNKKNGNKKLVSTNLREAAKRLRDTA